MLREQPAIRNLSPIKISSTKKTLAPGVAHRPINPKCCVAACICLRVTEFRQVAGTNNRMPWRCAYCAIGMATRISSPPCLPG